MKNSIKFGAVHTLLALAAIVLTIIIGGFLLGGIIVGMEAIHALTGATLNGSIYEQIPLLFGALVGGSVAFGILKAVQHHTDSQL